MVSAPPRPVLRYHGGKWKLAPWIVENMPRHRIYVEPFGGAASVLLRKPRSYAEVYNDLDGEVVNVFRVMRDQDSAYELRRRIELTPFSRFDFEAAYLPAADDAIERARFTIIKSFMGFGSGSIHNSHARGMRTAASTWRPSTGFRSNSSRTGTTPAADWRHYPEAITAFVDRLRGVVIENRPASEVISQHDREDCLIYVDPPYPLGCRDKGTDYRHEMSDDDHRELAQVLRAAKGAVMLSGYRCELYDTELYPDWASIQREHLADGARKRVEVLWMNELAARSLQQRLFITNPTNQGEIACPQ